PWFGCIFFFFFQAEDGIRDLIVTEVQTCALPISKVAAVGQDIPNVLPEGDPAGDLLVVSWGSTAGSITAAVKSARARGCKIGHRSEERRVGKEWRCRQQGRHEKKKRGKQSM